MRWLSILLVACGTSSSSMDAGNDGGHPCSIALSGEINTTLACTVAAGSVGFSIDVLATTTQPFRVTIPCDTPSEVKPETLTPPSCQASIQESGGARRAWMNEPDLQVVVTSVDSQKIGDFVVNGSAKGTMKSATGTVALQATF